MLNPLHQLIHVLRYNTWLNSTNWFFDKLQSWEIILDIITIFSISHRTHQALQYIHI